MKKKVLGFTKSDIIRALIHLPVGFYAGWLLSVNDMAGLVFAIGFICYEGLEDWKINDKSYKDMFGFLIGLGVSSFIFSFP